MNGQSNSHTHVPHPSKTNTGSSRRFKSNPQSNLETQDDVGGSRGMQRQAEAMQPLVAANINEKINQKSQRQNLINQKGAAPITDIRSKRQASTLNVEDLPPNTLTAQ